MDLFTDATLYLSNNVLHFSYKQKKHVHGSIPAESCGEAYYYNKKNGLTLIKRSITVQLLMN